MSTPAIDIGSLLNSFLPLIALVLVMVLFTSIFRSIGGLTGGG